MAQAVGRRPLAAAIQLLTRVIPCRIYGEQSGNGYFPRTSLSPVSAVSSMRCTRLHPQSNSYQKADCAKPGSLWKITLLLVFRNTKRLFYFVLSCCKTKFFVPLANFQGAHQTTIWVWLSKFRTCRTSSQSYAASYKSYKIMRMRTFVTLSMTTSAQTAQKAWLAAVQITKLLLQQRRNLL